MNETPNFLIRLGEALGHVGSLIVLLLICAGAVWVVMAIRRNQDDHARIENNVDAGFERLEKKIDAGFERVEGKVESSRKEARDESKETRAELRSINSRLDQLIGRKPPDQPS